MCEFNIKGVELATHSTFLAQTRLPPLVAALGVVSWCGNWSDSHAARPESVRQKTIADVRYQSKAGNYELTSSDGSYYWLGRDSFQPPLPDLTDNRYVGRPAWIMVDQGTVKGILIAIVLVLIGGLTFAVSFIRAVRRTARLDTRPYCSTG